MTCCNVQKRMGAYKYLPTLGRFLQTDPVEGGTDNAYVYVTDPINDNDYTGQFGWSNVKKIGKIVGAVAIVTVTAVAIVAAAPVVAATAGVIAAVAVGAAIGGVGAVAGYSVAQAGTKNFNKSAIAQVAAVGAGVGALGAGATVALVGTTTAGSGCAASGKCSKVPQLSGTYREYTNASGTKMVNANGYNFTQNYYNKLWTNGRPAPSLVADSILKNNPQITPDRMQGFNRYEVPGWEMVYNPITQEVWHIQPRRY